MKTIYLQSKSSRSQHNDNSADDIYPGFATLPLPINHLEGNKYKLVLRDRRNRIVPHQQEVVSYWDVHKLHPKWVHIFFEQKVKERYKVRKEIISSRISNVSSNSVRFRGNKMSNGLLTFDASDLDNISLKYNSKKVWQGDFSPHIVYEGVEYTGKIEKTKLVKGGRIKSIFKLYGRFFNENGDNLSWCEFGILLSMFSNSNQIHIDFKLSYVDKMTTEVFDESTGNYKTHDYESAYLNFPFLHIKDSRIEFQSGGIDLNVGAKGYYYHQISKNETIIRENQMGGNRPKKLKGNKYNLQRLRLTLKNKLEVNCIFDNACEKFPFELKVNKNKLAFATQPWHGYETFGDPDSNDYVNKYNFHKLHYIHSGQKQRHHLNKSFFDFAFDTAKAESISEAFVSPTTHPTLSDKQNFDYHPYNKFSDWHGMEIRQRFRFRISDSSLEDRSYYVKQYCKHDPIWKPSLYSLIRLNPFADLNISSGYQKILKRASKVIKSVYRNSEYDYYGRFRFGALPDNWIKYSRSRDSHISLHRHEYGDCHYNTIDLIYYYFLVTNDYTLLNIARTATEFYQNYRLINHTLKNHEASSDYHGYKTDYYSKHSAGRQWHKGLQANAFLDDREIVGKITKPALEANSAFQQLVSTHNLDDTAKLKLILIISRIWARTAITTKVPYKQLLLKVFLDEHGNIQQSAAFETELTKILNEKGFGLRIAGGTFTQQSFLNEFPGLVSRIDDIEQKSPNRLFQSIETIWLRSDHYIVNGNHHSNQPNLLITAFLVVGDYHYTDSIAKVFKQSKFKVTGLLRDSINGVKSSVSKFYIYPTRSNQQEVISNIKYLLQFKFPYEKHPSMDGRTYYEPIWPLRIHNYSQAKKLFFAQEYYSNDANYNFPDINTSLLARENSTAENLRLSLIEQHGNPSQESIQLLKDRYLENLIHGLFIRKLVILKSERAAHELNAKYFIGGIAAITSILGKLLYVDNNQSMNFSSQAIEAKINGFKGTYPILASTGKYWHSYIQVFNPDNQEIELDVNATGRSVTGTAFTLKLNDKNNSPEYPLNSTPEVSLKDQTPGLLKGYRIYSALLPNQHSDTRIFTYAQGGAAVVYPVTKQNLIECSILTYTDSHYFSGASTAMYFIFREETTIELNPDGVIIYFEIIDSDSGEKLAKNDFVRNLDGNSYTIGPKFLKDKIYKINIIGQYKIKFTNPEYTNGLAITKVFAQSENADFMLSLNWDEYDLD